MMSRRIVRFLTITVLLVGATLPVRAADIHVPADITTIQGAIDLASPGDTILVDPGVYAEYLRFNGKDVAVVSTGGPSVTKLHPEPLYATHGVDIGPGGVLQGFTIDVANIDTHGEGTVIRGNIFEWMTGYGWTVAVEGNSASPTIDGNLFRHNTTGNGDFDGMISFYNYSAPLIVNNVFIDNDARAITMVLPEGAAPHVINNTFIRNAAAITIFTSIPTVLHVYRNNLIVGNGEGVKTLYGIPENMPTWDHNLVYGNGADFVMLPDPTGTNGNISADPGIPAGAWDLRLPPGSPAVDAGSPDLAPALDYDGRFRPLDGNGDSTAAVDIGAFELDPQAVLDDLTPPTTTISQHGSRVWLVAMDDPAGSGVSATWLGIDGAAMEPYTGGITLSDGRYTLTFYSVDNAGISETVQTLEIVVDVTPPSTSLTYEGWPPTVTLTATDTPGGSGVQATFYSVGGGPLEVYSGPFTIPSDVSGYVTYYSVDNAGNVEPTQYAYVPTVDWYPPYTWANLFGDQVNGYFIGPVTVELVANDWDSGVAATYYAVDGGDTQTYTEPFTVDGDGPHSVAFWSIDFAGNVEGTEYTSFLIDASGPAITLAATIQQHSKRKDSLVPVDVSGAVQDAMLGVDLNSVTYSVTDEYGTVQPSGRVSLFPDLGYNFTVLLASARASDKDGRKFTIKVQAKDYGGNVGFKTATVVIMRR